MGTATRTLIIAPHMDDEAISTGGLIQDRISAGGEVMVLAVYGRVYEYGTVTVDESIKMEEEDFHEARKILGYQHFEILNMREGEPHRVGYYAVLKPIERVLSSFHPTEVVIPSGHDLNQDHQFLHHACKIALRPANLQGVKRILAAQAFDGELVDMPYKVAMTESQVQIKLGAMDAYRRERRHGNHPRAPRSVVAFHMAMGARAGLDYAECYDLVLERG